MASVKSSETKPEVLIRKYLFSRGFRYRKNKADLPGKPDIVLPKYKTVILVNGCFWHGHKNCSEAILPKSNREYWVSKIEGNIKRDKKNILLLKKNNWKVLVVWTCQLSNIVKREKKLQMIAQTLLSNISS